VQFVVAFFAFLILIYIVGAIAVAKKQSVVDLTPEGTSAPEQPKKPAKDARRDAFVQSAVKGFIVARLYTDDYALLAHNAVLLADALIAELDK
jgi:hypothetical protein